MPERRVEQQRSPAEPESNITELRPIERSARVTADTRPSTLNPPNVPAGPDPTFWAELNSTIDEFFAVIGQSRARIAELSSEMIKRDAMITLLEAQNLALRARLGIADSMPLTRTDDPKPADPCATPLSSDRRNDRSIWEKLTNLERNG